MYFNLPNLECDAIIHQAYFILQFSVLPGALFCSWTPDIYIEQSAVQSDLIKYEIPKMSF